MFGSASPSLADIAAVTKNGNGDGNYGFGEGWWVIIILLALFGGFGGYGYGNGGGGGATPYATSAVTNADLQRGFDTQSILGSLRGIEQGICNLGYDQLSQFNNIGMAIMTSGNDTRQAIQADTIANMQNTNALSTQISDCCCKTQSSLKDILFEMSQDTCATNNIIHQTGDAIINSQNNGFNMLERAINDKFCALEMAQKDAEIARLTSALNDERMDAKLQGMATYLINTIRPTAVPAYDAPSPFASCGCGSGWSRNNGCCNSGCC